VPHGKRPFDVKIGAMMLVLLVATPALLCAEDSYSAALSLYWDGRRLEQ